MHSWGIHGFDLLWNTSVLNLSLCKKLLALKNIIWQWNSLTYFDRKLLYLSHKFAKKLIEPNKLEYLLFFHKLFPPGFDYYSEAYLRNDKTLNKKLSTSAVCKEMTKELTLKVSGAKWFVFWDLVIFDLLLLLIRKSKIKWLSLEKEIEKRIGILSADSFTSKLAASISKPHLLKIFQVNLSNFIK